jgi:hypothetical protein
LSHGGVAPAGTVAWADFTADLSYPHVVRSRIQRHEDGSRWLYLATRGVGLWRRPLD